MKIIIGSIVAFGIAAALSKLAERDDIPEEERVPLTDSVKSTPQRLRERWEQAKVAGDAAKKEAEEHLTEVFRAKVNDPAALTEPKLSGS